MMDTAALTRPALALLIAFAAAVLLTPIVRRVAIAVGAVAVPKQDRWHKQPVPLLGGIGIAAATMIAFAFIGGDRSPVIPALVAGMAMFLVGVVDDALHLKPSTKLTAQIAAACGAVTLGATVAWTGYAPLDSFIAILWIVAVTNALNLLDNMDGLCAGIAAIAAIVFAVDLLDQPTVLSSYAAALAGACLGFLVYNFRPASIFMGDGGSLFLGISLATLSVVGGGQAGSHVALAVAIPVFILLIPIFDTTFVTVSRVLSTRSAAQGGRDHTSHRLVAMGFSETEAVLILWALGAAGGAAAVLGRYATFADMRLFAALLLLGLALLGLQLARVRVYDGKDFSLLLGRRYTPLLMNVTYKRRIFEVLLDLLLVTFCYYAAYVIRFDRDIALYTGLFSQSLPIIVACQLTSFFVSGVYRGTWRYVGVGDLTTYAKGIGLGVLSSVMMLVYLYRFEGYSRGVFLIDTMLLALLVIGSRVSVRLIGDAAGRHRRTGRRVLIYGAGDGGALVLRELRNNSSHGLEPVGFIDDDRAKHSTRMLRLPVLGGLDQLEQLIEERQPQAVILSTSKLGTQRMAALERVCRERGISLLQSSFRLEPIDTDLTG